MSDRSSRIMGLGSLVDFSLSLRMSWTEVIRPLSWSSSWPIKERRISGFELRGFHRGSDLAVEQKKWTTSNWFPSCGLSIKSRATYRASMVFPTPGGPAYQSMSEKRDARHVMYSRELTIGSIFPSFHRFFDNLLLWVEMLWRDHDASCRASSTIEFFWQ